MSEIPADPLSVSVVVVSWNSEDDLRACLNSLRAQTCGEVEAIVVDNGSTDGTVQMVKQEYPEVILLDTGENLGFAEGCNRGIEASSGAWIATLNPDAAAAPNWIEEMRKAIRQGGPRLGMLQSKILFKKYPDVTNSTGVLLFSDGSAYDRDFKKLSREDDEIEEIFCPSAGAALYRRTMLDQVRLASGVFDRTFFMYFEDLDLGWRCRLAGWDANYVPQAKVFHRFHASANRVSSHFVTIQCRHNRLRALLKNGSRRFLFNGLRGTAEDLVVTYWFEGAPGLAKYRVAFEDGIRQRADVRRLTSVDRKIVERAWVRTWSHWLAGWFVGLFTDRPGRAIELQKDN